MLNRGVQNGKLKQKPQAMKNQLSLDSMFVLFLKTSCFDSGSPKSNQKNQNT